MTSIFTTKSYTTMCLNEKGICFSEKETVKEDNHNPVFFTNDNNDKKYLSRQKHKLREVHNRMQQQRRKNTAKQDTPSNYRGKPQSVKKRNDYNV
jgi:hypothetical protein